MVGPVAVSVAGIISGSLSLVGAILVIFTFFAYDNRNNFRSRLVLYLAIADFVWEAALYIGLVYFLYTDPPDWTSGDWAPEGLCTTLGFFLQWFVHCTSGWMITIALYLYLLMVHNKDIKDKEWIMHVCCWGIPLIIAFVPLGLEPGYGIAGTWCYIASEYYRLIFATMFIWISWGIILILYARIGWYIYQQSKTVAEYVSEESRQSRESRNRKIFLKLALFPLVYFIQWFPATINRIQNAVEPNNPNNNLFMAQVLFAMSGGFLNFLVYGLQKRRRIRKARPFSQRNPANTSNTSNTVDLQSGNNM